MSPEYKHICKALSFRGKRLQRVGKVFFTIFAKKQIRTTRGRPHTSECQRGGHETCALWPPPAPFGYFPARGKYLVRPQAGETSHKKQISCERQETGLPFFSVSQRISPLRRRPGGFPIAPWTPSGPIPVCVGETCHKKPLPCGRHEKGLPFPLPPFGASFPKPNTGGGTASSGSVPPPVLFYSALVSSNPAASSGCFLM